MAQEARDLAQAAEGEATVSVVRVDQEQVEAALVRDQVVAVNLRESVAGCHRANFRRCPTPAGSLKGPVAERQ